MPLYCAQGEESFSGPSPLVLSRGPEGAGKSGTERLPERTGRACPQGEDWSGGFSGFRLGLGINVVQL